NSEEAVEESQNSEEAVEESQNSEEAVKELQASEESVEESQNSEEAVKELQACEVIDKEAEEAIKSGNDDTQKSEETDDNGEISFQENCFVDNNFSENCKLCDFVKIYNIQLSTYSEILQDVLPGISIFKYGNYAIKFLTNSDIFFSFGNNYINFSFVSDSKEHKFWISSEQDVQPFMNCICGDVIDTNLEENSNANKTKFIKGSYYHSGYIGYPLEIYENDDRNWDEESWIKRIKKNKNSSEDITWRKLVISPKFSPIYNFSVLFHSEFSSVVYFENNDKKNFLMNVLPIICLTDNFNARKNLLFLYFVCFEYNDEIAYIQVCVSKSMNIIPLYDIFDFPLFHREGFEILKNGKIYKPDNVVAQQNNPSKNGLIESISA
ncbi:hypothetical protein EDEG_01487, partial [Edhazardia aedis USNM 41457]